MLVDTEKDLGKFYQVSAWAKSSSSHIKSGHFPTMLEALNDFKPKLGRKRPTIFNVRSYAKLERGPYTYYQTELYGDSLSVSASTLADLEKFIVEDQGNK